MDKELWLIWKNPKSNSRRRYKVGKLSATSDGYIFEYSDDVDEAAKDGFQLYPGFDNRYEKYKSQTLFKNIKSRIPDRERIDFLDIINTFNLSPNSSDIDILAATKGRLPTDNFEFVPAITNTDRLEFNIAGTRYREKDLENCAVDLVANAKLELVHNKNNPFDTNAIEIHFKKITKDYFIGYVPRYYAKYLADHLDNGAKYSALVKKVIEEPQNNDDKYSVEVKLVIE